MEIGLEALYCQVVYTDKCVLARIDPIRDKLYLLGLVERSAHHLPDARTSLEVAAKLQPTEAPVFDALGEVLLEQGEREAALAAFEKAVKLAPDNPAFRQNLESVRPKQ